MQNIVFVQTEIGGYIYCDREDFFKCNGRTVVGAQMTAPDWSSFTFAFFCIKGLWVRDPGDFLAFWMKYGQHMNKDSGKKGTAVDHLEDYSDMF